MKGAEKIIMPTTTTGKDQSVDMAASRPVSSLDLTRLVAQCFVDARNDAIDKLHAEQASVARAY